MVLAGRSRDELFSSAATEVLGCSWEIDPNGIHVCYLPAPLESSEKLHYGLQATYRGRPVGLSRGSQCAPIIALAAVPHRPQRLPYLVLCEHCTRQSLVLPALQ